MGCGAPVLFFSVSSADCFLTRTADGRHEVNPQRSRDYRLRRGSGMSGILAAAAAAAAPCGPVVVHPVEQSGFEADVLSGGFAEAPFVAEDFVAFREVIAVGGGTARGIFAFVVAGGICGHGWGGGIQGWHGGQCQGVSSR